MLAAARERRQKAVESQLNLRPNVSMTAPAAVGGCSRAAVSLSVAARMLARHRHGNGHVARSAAALAGATKDADVPATRDPGDSSRSSVADAGTYSGTVAAMELKAPYTQQMTTALESSWPPAEHALTPTTVSARTIPCREPEPEPEPELRLNRVQHDRSEELEYQVEELPQHLAAAERRDRSAAVRSCAELERHKNALVEAELDAVASRSESQQAVATAVHAELAAAARLAVFQRADSAAGTAALRRESNAAQAKDAGGTVATQIQLELNRVTEALSASEAQLAEARVELQQAQESEREWVQRAAAETELLRRELNDARKTHCQATAAAAAAQIELEQQKSLLTETQKRLDEAILKRKRDETLRAEELENVRSEHATSERSRHMAEAALDVCVKRLSAVEAAEWARQLAATAEKNEAELAEERNLVFRKRLDAVTAELEEVEELCQTEKAHYEQDLQREKEAAQMHREDAERLRKRVEGKEEETRALRAQLQEAWAGNAALQRELLGATGVRDAAVAEAEAVRMRAEMEIANAQFLAGVWQRQMSSTTLGNVRSAGVAAAESVAGTRHALAERVRESRPVTDVPPAQMPRDRPQMDPRAAMRWARIRMRLMRLDGESQRRQRHLTADLAKSTPESPGCESLLDDSSFPVTPVREPAAGDDPARK